jgi:peptidoglycan hydrolase-like protein with peptidoglycan-binding domain
MAAKTTVKYPKYGDKGAAVTKVQRMLVRSGSTIKVTGEFTIGMTAAIRCFQKKNGLNATGKLDAKTMNALESFMVSKKKTR